MRRLPLLPALLLTLLIVGCPPDPEPDPEPVVPDITELEFEDFSTWAWPIEDYIEAGVAEHGAESQFMTDIHDLHVFADKLYVGYGDATVNMGRVFPIDVRAWTSPEPEALVSEFVTDEEQIDRYRSQGDILTIPGIDATEDAWLGSVYAKPSGKAWFKSRTLKQGVHVHDCITFGGAWYAVGSGATQAEWTASNIHSLLWKSTDRKVKSKKQKERVC